MTQSSLISGLRKYKDKNSQSASIRYWIKTNLGYETLSPNTEREREGEEGEKEEWGKGGNLNTKVVDRELEVTAASKQEKKNCKLFQ